MDDNTPQTANHLTLAESEMTQRYQGIVSLLKAVGSQLGAGGDFPVLGSVLFMNAEAIAAEIAGVASRQPMLGIFADMIVKAALQVTAGQEMPDAMRSGYPDNDQGMLYP